MRAFWGSLGLLLGALGGLLGALLGLQIDPKGLPRSDPFALWVVLGIFFLPFCRFWLPKMRLRVFGRPFGLLLGALGGLWSALATVFGAILDLNT